MIVLRSETVLTNMIRTTGTIKVHIAGFDILALIQQLYNNIVIQSHHDSYKDLTIAAVHHQQQQQQQQQQRTIEVSCSLHAGLQQR